MASVLEELIPDRTKTEGLTSSALQEYLDALQSRITQVRHSLCEHTLRAAAPGTDAAAGPAGLEQQQQDEEGLSLETRPAAAAAATPPRRAQGGEEEEEAAPAPEQLAFLEGLQALRDVGGEHSQHDARLTSLAQHYRATFTELQRVVEAKETLQVVASLQDKLRAADECVATGRFSDGAALALELDRVAQGGGQDLAQGGGSGEWAAVQAACRQRSERVASSMWSALEQAIAVVQGQQLQVLAQLPSGGALSDLWEGLSRLGRLQQAAEWLAGLLQAQVVEPLLATNASVTLHGSRDMHVLQWRAQTHGSAATSATAAEGGGSPQRQQPPEAALLALLRFVTSRALASDRRAAAALGASLWPVVAAQYVDCCLRPALPRSDADIEQLQAVAGRAQHLETQAAALGLLDDRAAHGGSSVRGVGGSPGPGGAVAGPVQRAVKKALDEFLHSKRARVVTAARALLMRDDLYDVVSAGTPLPGTANPASPFLSPSPSSSSSLPQHQNQAQQPTPPSSYRENGHVSSSSSAAAAAKPSLNGGIGGGGGWCDVPLGAAGTYQISRCAAKLQLLMEQALNEAVASGSAAICMSMCQGLADVAALIATLPPAAKARQLQAPALAALYHNDCCHLAGWLLTAPHRYRPGLAPVLHLGTCSGGGVDSSGAGSSGGDGVSGGGGGGGGELTFLECAASLRDTGKAVLREQVVRMQEELLLVLDGTGGLRRVHDAQRGIAVRRAVQQLLHSFRKVGDVLGGLLAPRDHVAVASLLLQAVSDRIAGDVMSIPEISIDEAEDLPRMLGPFLEEAPAALVAGAVKQRLRAAAAATRDARAAAAAAAAAGTGAGVGEGEGDGGNAPAATVAPAEAAAVVVERLDEVELQAALVERTSAFRRLKGLLDLMPLRLADIKQRWDAGQLSTVPGGAGLSPADVVHMLEALFEDTEMRREAMQHVLATAAAAH